MQVAQFTFNDFQENTYIAHDSSLECVIIDPGCKNANEQNQLTTYINDMGLKPVKLINTHCHIDHVLGNAFVAKYYQLELYLHKDELITYADTGRWADMFGLVMDEIPEKKVFIEEGQQLQFGETTLQILFTPGHSIASLSFFEAKSQQVFAGDVLFYGSIGRTDLPGGNMKTLTQSIHHKLFNLPDNTTVWSGHGPKTTIGYEKRTNPFVGLF